MKPDSLSVFFPSYNEEKNIPVTVEKAVKVLEKLENEWEILIIDDGSKDDTGKVADELARKHNNVKVIHQPNGGYGMALRAGFSSAKYPIIIYTDADGQFDFSEVDKFLELSKTNDLIIGYRLKRNDPLFRLLFAKGWALSLFVFFGLMLKDVDCGFKLVKREVLDKIPPLKSTRGGMINAELAIKAKKYGFKVGQVGVHHYPRMSGKPTGAKLGVIIQSYIDLINLRWSLR